MSRTAASLEFADVNFVINGGGPDSAGDTYTAAPDGETINLKPGTTVTKWPQAIAILDRNLTIRGQSRISATRDGWVSQTTIVGSSTGTFNFKTANSTNTAWLCNLDIDSSLSGNYTLTWGGVARFNPVANNGGIRMSEVRIFNTDPATGGEKHILIKDFVTGVFDHCFYDVFVGKSAMNWLEIDPAGQPGFQQAKTPPPGSGINRNVSLSITNPGTVTLAGHGLKEGQGIMFLTAGSLPGGITTNKVYYVKTPASDPTNTFNVSAAPFGTAIAFTGTQSGQQQINACDNWPCCGLYSASYPWDWGNDYSGIYIEDCYLQRSGFLISMSDGPPQPGGGGARVVYRHNSGWGGCSPHGWDESSGNVGGVAVEAYNNFWYSPSGSPPAMYNMRAGSLVAFNTRSIGYLQETARSPAQKNALGRADYFHCNANPFNHVHGGMDGTNFFDQNARGGLLTIKTDFPTNQTYVPWETTASGGTQTLPTGTFTVADNSAFPSSGIFYVNTTSNGTQAVSYGGKGPGNTTFNNCTNGTGSVPNGAAVVGPLKIVITPSTPDPDPYWGRTTKTFAPVQYQLSSGVTGAIDTSAPGVPTDTRIGAVYAQGSGATGQNTYTLPLDSSSYGDDQWVGFTIRNKMGRRPVLEYSPNNASETEQSGGGTTHGDVSFRIVTSSSVSGTSTIVGTTGKHDPVGGGAADTASIWDPDQNWEMRFVVNGLGMPGQEPGIPLTDGRVTGGDRIHFYETVNGKNKYWCNPPAGGMWFWDNFARNLGGGTPPAISSTILTATFQSMSLGTHRLMRGGMHQGVSPAGVRPGYKSQTNDPVHLRIGPDWDTGTFGGVRNSDKLPIRQLQGFIPSNDPDWPATAAYGQDYPHPLVAGAGPPSFPSTARLDWLGGVLNTYTFNAGGNPTPTYAVQSGSLPASTTLDPNGFLHGTPASFFAVFVFVVRATNTQGFSDQTVTINVTPVNNNVAPTCSITSPATGVTVAPGDPVNIVVNMADDGQVTQLVIKDGSTTLTTITTSPLPAASAVVTYPTSFAALGSHVITATATDNAGAFTASAGVTINVQTVQPPLSAPTIVVTAGGDVTPPPSTNLFFVDPAGSDSNAGTSAASPWKTIQKAMNSATAGSTVNIKGGTYNERLTLNVSGTAGNPIIFQPLGYTGLGAGNVPGGASIAANGYVTCVGDQVLLDYAYLGTVTTDSTPFFLIRNKSYVIIQGLTFQNYTCTGSFKQGVRIDNGSHDIQFLNNRFLNNKNTFGTFDPATQAFLHIRIWSGPNIVFRGNELGNIWSNGSEALTMDAPADGVLIESNYVHDTDAIGLDINGNIGNAGATNCIIRANLLEWIARKRSDGTAWYGNPSIGIYVQGGNNSIIERNVIRDSEWAIEVLTEPSYPATHDIIVRNNVAYRNDQGALQCGNWYSNTDGTSVYNIQYSNNTAYSNRHGIYIRPYTLASVSWKNNILSNNTNNYVLDAPGAGTLNYNLYFGGNSGPDTNKITTDPKFITTTGNANLSLQGTSPAINAGDPAFTAAADEIDFLGNPRVLGGRVDMGAYEVA